MKFQYELHGFKIKEQSETIIKTTIDQEKAILNSFERLKRNRSK